LKKPSGQRFLVGASGPERRGPEARSATSLVLVFLGAAFALVGLTDLLLLWFPLGFGNPAWEYATLGRTFDALPMPTLGLGLVAYGLGHSPRFHRDGLKVTAAVFAALALIILAMTLLFVTVAPVVISNTPAEAAAGVKRSAVRHGVQAVVYPIAFWAIAYLLWKKNRS
jgi:hypothetical protein